MSWLKGSTDITNFAADLYALLTGTMAAGQRGSGQSGNGVTASATDKWISVDATNLVIRTQATEPPYMGERRLWRGAPRFASRANATILSPTATREIGKPTFNGAYSGGTTRVYFAAFVAVNNSSPGSLTSTQVSWTLVNATTGATVTSGTATGWTGSSDTKLLAQGVSLTLTLLAGETFVAGTNAIMWLRAYDTTHTDGIDFFPEASRLDGGVVLSNTSGAAANYISGTDYDVVQSIDVFPQVSTTIGFHSSATDWGGNGCGCGIHWKTGGTPAAVGAYYFLHDHLLYLAWLESYKITSVGGNRTLTGGPMQAWDGVLAHGRFVMTTANNITTTLNTTTSYATLFTGTAQPGSTFINFWISVKPDRIICVFRGDPGQSGRTVVMVFCKYTTLVTSDKHPWVFIPDGSILAASGPGMLVNAKYYYENDYYGVPGTAIAPINLISYYGPQPSTSNQTIRLAGISVEQGSVNVMAMPDQNPNNWDLRWWLYSVYLMANNGGSNLVGTFDATKQSGIRGKLPGIFGVALDNFSSFDELIDGSNTYLLVQPTSTWGNGVGAAYNSVAILET